MARDEIYDVIKEACRSKFNADRAKFLHEARSADDGGWIKHGKFHWSRTVDGARLDYWPSRKKFQFRGKVRRGDVMRFVASHGPA
jgi:hypothetical protein